MKLATNTTLYERMTEDMDIKCGDIIEGNCTVEEKGRQIFELMLRTASGAKSKSEACGMGSEESVPWYLGGVM